MCSLFPVAIFLTFIKNGETENQGLVVQSVVSLKSSLLMTNLLTVVAKVLSNTLIFLLQKCE